MSQDFRPSRDQPSEGSDSIRIESIPPGLIWKAAAILATALVAAIAVGWTIRLIIHPIGLLLAGIIIAMTLAPVAGFFERWLPRSAAILLVYGILLLAIVGIGSVLIPPLVSQMQSLVENWVDLRDGAEEWLDNYGIVEMDEITSTLTEQVGQIVNYVALLPVEIASRGFEVLLVLFVSLYWLLVLPTLREYTLSLFPANRRDEAGRVLGEMGQRMGGYLRAVAIDGFILGVIVYVGLTVIGVQFALILAMVAFVGEFVPILGPIFAAIPALIVALIDSPTQFLIVLVFYIIVQQIEAYVILPNIMQGQAHIPPLLVIIALHAGFIAGGILWGLIAIPLSGALMVMATDVIGPAVRSSTGAERSGAAEAIDNQVYREEREEQQKQAEQQKQEERRRQPESRRRKQAESD